MRVLCVSDHPDWLGVTEQVLRTNGFEVLSAPNCTRGFALAAERHPDLILLDSGAKDRYGCDFCARMQEKEELAWIPIVLVTDDHAKHDRAEAVAIGAVDWLSTKADAATLVSSVRRHVQTRVHWRELRRPERAPRPDFSAFKAFLMERAHIPAERRRRLLEAGPRSLYQAGAELGIPAATLARLIAEFCRLPFVERINPQEVRLGVLPPAFCHMHSVTAVGDAAGTQAFVLANPFDLDLLEDLKLLAGVRAMLPLVIADPEEITELYDPLAARRRKPADDGAAVRVPAGKLFQARASVVQEESELARLYDASDPPTAVAEEPAEDAESAGPAVKLIDKILANAVDMDASDVHIEPEENEVVVRYRVDGDLRIVHRLKPHRVIHRLVSRVKIMAGLNISEHRLPQDGRIAVSDAIDLRVSVMPMFYGEKVVLRILDKRRSALPLDDLGLSPRHLALYREKIRIPYGLLLHVGPTGSGKSMLMFSALREIQAPELNITTIEDPIEYRLPGINQMQAHAEIGLTFHRALRSLLRQDPDVVLVGEIRDPETAEVAVEAANTGHLLLSTVHTNDAASTVIRLIEMGIEPYLVSSTLALVCAQRLLRRLCLHCRTAVEAGDAERRLVGVPEGRPLTLYKAKGCAACDGTGYRGRIGVHELLDVDDRLREVLTRHGATAESLKHLAVGSGLTTLYWDAMEKVRAGVTSLTEALAQIRKDDFDARPNGLCEEMGVPKPNGRRQSTGT